MVNEGMFAERMTGEDAQEICRLKRGLAIASRRGGGGEERRVRLQIPENVGTRKRDGSTRLRAQSFMRTPAYSMSELSVVEFGCDGQRFTQLILSLLTWIDSDIGWAAHALIRLLSLRCCISSGDSKEYTRIKRRPLENQLGSQIG